MKSRVEWAIEDVAPTFELREMCGLSERIVSLPCCGDVWTLPEGMEYCFYGVVVAKGALAVLLHYLSPRSY